MTDEGISSAARRWIEELIFIWGAERLGLIPHGGPGQAVPGMPSSADLVASLRNARDRLGSALFDVEGCGGAHGVEKTQAAALATFSKIDTSVVRRAHDICFGDDSRGAASEQALLLGSTHEHLLGRAVRRNEAGKCEMRKSAGHKRSRGIFYTPAYVADYIASQAMGSLKATVESFGRIPRGFRLLDPCCGCGAFLLAACRQFQRCAANRGSIDPMDMLSVVHGIDLDPEAVLIARRTLLFLAWELAGRSRASCESPPEDRVKSLVTLLAENIRCRDALADSLGKEFAGEFDVVLGNPPYLRELDAKRCLDRIAETELGRRYRTARMDLWYYFAHRGLEWLRPGGRLAFIVDSYWTAGRGAEKLIQTLRESCHIDEVFLLDRLRVFPGVSGRHLILTVTKGSGRGHTTVKRAKPGAVRDAEPFVRGIELTEVYSKTPEQLFVGGRFDLEPPEEDFSPFADGCVPLGALGVVRQGIVENPASITPKMARRYSDRWRVGRGVFALRPDELSHLNLPEGEMSVVRPYHVLRDLGRYDLASTPSLALIYATRQTWPDAHRFPTLRAHLEQFRPLLDARRETQNGVRPWWHLHWPREESLWRRPKVLALQMAPRPAFVPAREPVFVPFSVNVFAPHEGVAEHLNYFAAVLNSGLLWRWFRRNAKHRGVGLEINGHVLARSPIRRIDFDDSAQRAPHDRLVALVDEFLRQNRQRRASSDESEREAIRQRQNAIDAEIDGLVEGLYAADPGL